MLKFKGNMFNRTLINLMEKKTFPTFTRILIHLMEKKTYP